MTNPDMKLAHGKAHLKTGLFILITVLLTNATFFVAQYSEEEYREFVGQVQNLNRGGGTKTAALNNYPTASVLVPEFDPVTGARSLAVHVCQSSDFGVFGHYCSRSDLTDSALAFKEFAENTAHLEYAPLFRPQDADGNDVLDLDLWTDFVFNFVKILFNPNYNVNALLIDSHGLPYELVLAEGIEGASRSFYQELSAKVNSRLKTDPQLAPILRHFLEEGFYNDPVSYEGSYISIGRGFVQAIPKDRWPDFTIMNTCYGGDFVFANKLHIGSRPIAICYQSENNIEILFNGLLGKNGMLFRTTKALEEGGGWRGDWQFTSPYPDYNFSLSPAFKDVQVTCTSPRTFEINAKLDTYADPNEDALGLIKTGNISRISPAWDEHEYFHGYVFPTKLFIAGQCNGVCNGSVVVNRLNGVAMDLSEYQGPAPSPLGYQGLNGDQIPQGEGDGVLANFRDFTEVLDDPRVIPVICKGGRERLPTAGQSDQSCPPGGCGGAGGPIIVIPPPTCAEKKQRNPGSVECVVNADCDSGFCPAIPSCDQSTCKCVNICPKPSGVKPLR